MVVCPHVLSSRDAFEAIQVQLSLEGFDPCMPEVFGEHLANEPALVEYLEGRPVADPANDLGFLVLQNGEELHDKGTHALEVPPDDLSSTVGIYRTLSTVFLALTPRW